MFVRKGIYLIAIVAIAGSICFLFWEESYRYTLPAQKPTLFKEVRLGEKVTVPFPTKRSLFIHFHNLECPCSRFNISEFQEIVRTHNSQLDFVVMLITNGDKNSVKKFNDKYQLDIPIIEDVDGKKSYALGVYATPQAMIVNGKDSTVYYSGNYNLGRYCTAKNTRFAEMAIESLLSGKVAPLLPDIAYLPFGCELNRYEEINFLTKK